MDWGKDHKIKKIICVLNPKYYTSYECTECGLEISYHDVVERYGKSKPDIYFKNKNDKFWHLDSLPNCFDVIVEKILK